MRFAINNKPKEPLSLSLSLSMKSHWKTRREKDKNKNESIRGEKRKKRIQKQ